MEEYCNISGVLRFSISRKVKATEMQNICAVYGEGAVTDGTC